MDVRAADVSSLAAKRLELEKVRPVRHKDTAQHLTDQRFAVEKAGDDEEQQKQQNQEQPAAENQAQDEAIEIVETPGYKPDGSADTGLSDHHILDFKA